MVGNRLLYFLLIMWNLSFAVPMQVINKDLKINESAAVINKKQLNVDSSIINRVDQDSDNINALKRKLELERVKADIQKTKSDFNHASLGGVSGETTVTSVYIEEDGTKNATLQFIDGSNLDVEIGSLVGQYVVSDISMTGVTLTKQSCKTSRCIQKIKIKRLYSKINNIVTNNTSISYRATPAIMDKNNQTVPPIISQ